MKRAHMRPRIERVVPGVTPQILQAKLKARFAFVANPKYEAQMGGSHLAISPRTQHRRFWSPTLDTHIRPHPEGSVIVGRLSPHAHVWTLYISSYAFLSFLAMIGGIYGLVQWHLGQYPLGLWAPPTAFFLATLLFASAFLGQRMSGEEMDALREFLEDALRA